MKLRELQRDIKERRSGDDPETYQYIADSYGITKAMVYMIEKGHRPGKQVSSILNLEPSKSVMEKRVRRKRLDEIAKSWGYKGWWDYGSEVIKKEDELCNTDITKIIRIMKD